MAENSVPPHKQYTGIVERIRNASSHDELQTLVSTFRAFRYSSDRTHRRCIRAAQKRSDELSVQPAFEPKRKASQ